MKLSTTVLMAAIAAIGQASGPVSFDLSSRNMPQLNLAAYIAKPVADKLDKVGEQVQDAVDGLLHPRDGEDEAPPQQNLTLTPSYNFYITNISIGSPEQNLEVGFDTGSPFLWVYGPNGSFGNAAQFYPDKSSTFKYQNRTFNAGYGAGALSGKWGEDSLHVGEDSLSGFPFGVIEKFTLNAGIPGLIGIGPGPNLTNETYSNVPEAFYEKEVTNSPMFSVFLDNDSKNGGVIFGGYDDTKYEQPVYEFDIAQNSMTARTTYYYQLRINDVALNGEKYTVSNVAVLDTGSPFCQLPPGFVKKVAEKYGLQSYPKYQAYYKSENSTEIKDTDTISITIGKFTADIPLKDMFVPGEYLWVDDGPKNVQALGIMGAPSYVLGDVFFKHAYAAFDSRNHKVYLAKSTHDFTKSNVKEFTDEKGFPGAIQGIDPSSQTGPTTLTPRPAATTAPGGGGLPPSQPMGGPA